MEDETNPRKPKILTVVPSAPRTSLTLALNKQATPRGAYTKQVDMYCIITHFDSHNLKKDDLSTFIVLFTLGGHWVRGAGRHFWTDLQVFAFFRALQPTCRIQLPSLEETTCSIPVVVARPGERSQTCCSSISTPYGTFVERQWSMFLLRIPPPAIFYLLLSLLPR